MKWINTLVAWKRMSNVFVKSEHKEGKINFFILTS
jgi:hypothetical protein